MPEAPEIRFEYDRIHRAEGHLLQSINILSGRYTHQPLPNLKELRRALPQRITRMGVKGKSIWWELENGMSLFFTHGMTGGWKVDGEIKREYSGRWFQPRHDRIRFTTDNLSLVFNDMRNFGTIHIATNKEELQKRIDRLGVSVLDRPTEKEFWERFEAMRNKEKPIGLLLMEQTLVSGIGNYLRANILWLSRVSPYRPYSSLTPHEKTRIYRFSTSHAMFHYRFMKRHGEIFPEGRENTFLVYGRQKDPLGNRVVAERMGDRTIHWVPSYQV